MPATNVSQYTLATVADFLARYDARRVADLVGDQGVRVDPSTLTISSSAAYGVIYAALTDATATILAAATTAARYSFAQLYGDSTTTPATPGSNLARRLCCDLAFGLLTGRRGYSEGQQNSLTPRAKEAQQMLQALREGQRIFDCYTVSGGVVQSDLSNAEAGLPKGVKQTPFDDPSLLTSNPRLFGVRLGNPYPNGW